MCIAAGGNIPALASLDAEKAASSFSSRLWQIEDGLPHNIVQAITQTRDGYLWVGTREGLARFDGVRFQTIDLPTQNKHPSVYSLLESADGTLWIGTESFGLLTGTNGVFSRRASPDREWDFAVHELHASGGDIWAATSKGLFRYQANKSERICDYKRGVECTCVDNKGGIWLAGGRLRRLDNTNEPPVTHALLGEVRKAYCDVNGTFWLAAQNGLTEMSNKQFAFFPKASGPAGFIDAIRKDRQGELWIGTYSGLSRFANGRFINEGDPDESLYRIFALYEDREGALWVGSEEGLRRMTQRGFRTYTKKDGLSLNTVVAVCPSSDGGVWVSAWGGGLNHISGNGITSLGKTNGLSSDFIMAIHESRDGSLWAGTDYNGGLNQINGGKIIHYDKEQGFSSPVTRCLAEDASGVLWIGTHNALQSYSAGNFSRYTTVDGLSNNKINALCVGRADVLWVGTDTGLTRRQHGSFVDMSEEAPALKTEILRLV